MESLVFDTSDLREGAPAVDAVPLNPLRRDDSTLELPVRFDLERADDVLPRRHIVRGEELKHVEFDILRCSFLAVASHSTELGKATASLNVLGTGIDPGVKVLLIPTIPMY